MNPIHEIPYRGCTIKVFPDEDPLNPRTEYDQLTRMICFHRRYSLGDKHDYRREDFGGIEELEARLREDFDAVVMKPLYLLDHSGLWLRTTGFEDVDPHGWDWGFVGFVVLPRGVAEANGLRGAQAEAALDAEVREYSQYLEGDVYVFTWEDLQGNVQDSLGNVYLGPGETVDSYCVVAEYKAAIDNWLKEKAS